MQMQAANSTVVVIILKLSSALICRLVIDRKPPTRINSKFTREPLTPVTCLLSDAEGQQRVVEGWHAMPCTPAEADAAPRYAMSLLLTPFGGVRLLLDLLNKSC